MSTVEQEVRPMEMGKDREKKKQQQHEIEEMGSDSSSSTRSHLPRRNRRTEASEMMPEWKLKCLCTENGMPPLIIMTGTLNMGSGCF
ncbi:hypothetical protein Cni_G10864 [Canna indica]|uniref:Uncharacterized protein n=1 Tax=Canna indica TaxID=4628 RepID=A0AAQ3QB33_9LILI|nr:hypothetical protein Cni_G10864 [Canna indica]